MLIHAWMYCSYYDRLLIMGDDMFIIAYEQAVIMHDQRHIHVIMNIIVNPTSKVLLQNINKGLVQWMPSSGLRSV